eukprot:8965305-Ditylum_brightwellii.AAC.1
MGLASVLHDSDGFKDAGVSEFTVEFEKERKIFGPDSILEENMSINYKKSATKVICRHDGLRKYSIEVLDIISTTGGVAATLSHKSPRSAYSEKAIFPMISFSGKIRGNYLKSEWGVAGKRK